MTNQKKNAEEQCFIAPPVDVYQTDEGLTALVDLPGVALEDVEINVDDDLLTISGRTIHAPEGRESLHSEFRLVNFRRQFTLGSEVDQEKISAGMKDGVLTLTLPRVEKARPKKIEVKVA
jgi:HSP20 family protein